jgi:hypothetical protein
LPASGQSRRFTRTSGGDSRHLACVGKGGSAPPLPIKSISYSICSSCAPNPRLANPRNRRHRWLALRARHPCRNRRLTTAGRSGAHNRTQPRQSPRSRCRMSQASQGKSCIRAIARHLPATGDDQLWCVAVAPLERARDKCTFRVNRPCSCFIELLGDRHEPHALSVNGYSCLFTSVHGEVEIKDAFLVGSRQAGR